MKNLHLENKILKTLSSEQDVFLVGPSDSGKTWFIKNRLLPFFSQNHKKVVYFSNCEKISASRLKNADYIIVDEVETMQDLKFLETIYPQKKPYYSDSYKTKVKIWFKLLKSIKQPGIFVVTRKKQTIDYFLKNIITPDWHNKKVKVIEFNKKSSI
ncbi:hypothetical protein KJ840_02985 [Patescibacteria group bacterium]|nr:hypothetical protein [Patescibacteria group bacterium]